ncbi:cupin domain-containing protein [Roseovarius sp.]|uniref:cupin domain-containing protein n=1 Tax=Roseovarius sp. TaxID=1486281 RepID=UPI003B5955A9
MRRYRPGDDVGPLEHWPFDAPQSAYRIVRGDPVCHGRLDSGGPGHATRAGIWRCSEGAFDCTEQGDEMMVILQGRCRITDHASGDALELGPGDTAFVRDGMRVTWDVSEEVTKAFMGWKSGGY